MDVLRLLSEADHRARSGVLPVEASIRRGCSNDASILGDADAADVAGRVRRDLLREEVFVREASDLSPALRRDAVRRDAVVVHQRSRRNDVDKVNSGATTKVLLRENPITPI